MPNALELLQQKELDLDRIRKETEALRIVAPLLCDDRDQLAEMKKGLRGEQFELQATGTDDVPYSAGCVVPLRDGEITGGQPFLIPKPTNRASNVWQRLCELKSTVLLGVRRPARRWWYGAAGGMIIVVAIVGYLLEHRMGLPVSATASSPGPTAASTKQSTPYTEPTPDPLRVVVHDIDPAAQRPNAKQSETRESGPSATGAAAASTQQSTSYIETGPDQLRVVVQAIDPAAQRPNANQSESGESGASANQELDLENSLALFDSLATSSQASSDQGSVELMMGRRYLQGQGVAEDHAEAARWLWKSVAKQNAEAALLLAGLFARGDGVAKSCAQARVLLTVAANHSPKTGATMDFPEKEACQ